MASRRHGAAVLYIVNVERWPSGLRRTLGKRVYVNSVPWVRIPLSPPNRQFCCLPGKPHPHAQTVLLERQRYLVRRIEDNPSVEVWTGCRITGVDGDAHLEHVVCLDDAGSSRSNRYVTCS